MNYKRIYVNLCWRMKKSHVNLGAAIQAQDYTLADKLAKRCIKVQRILKKVRSKAR